MSAYQVIIHDLIAPPRTDTPEVQKVKKETCRSATVSTLVFLVLFVLFGTIWYRMGYSNWALFLALLCGFFLLPLSVGLIKWSRPYCEYEG